MNPIRNFDKHSSKKDTSNRVKKVVFILGGARSGKSSYAVELAKKLSKRVVFIATAAAGDEEMKKRIKMHKASRPKYWRVIEESKNISSILPKLNDKYEVLIIDCVGLLISNLLAEGAKDREIEKRIKKLINIISKVKLNVVLVSNEAGCGIVPDNFLARRFRDLLGLANQMMARKADKVIFMQAGIPVMIKGLPAGRQGGQKDAKDK